MKSSSAIPLIIVVTLGALALAGFVVTHFQEGPATSSARDVDGPPAYVSPVPGSDVPAITLTPRAAERLGIATAVVTESPFAVPYAAVLYGTHGETWVYTNPERLLYMRHAIQVDRIDGDQAILVSGPPAGAAVVTTGAAELLGVEFGVGK